jgi:hypothetical protein
MVANDKGRDNPDFDAQGSANENVGAPVEKVKYSTIKRMLGTLDKFLSKKFVFLLGLYFVAMALCMGGLFINNSGTGSAASGSAVSGMGPDIALNTWLWATIAVATLLAIFLVIYIIAKRRSSPVDKSKF